MLNNDGDSARISIMPPAGPMEYTPESELMDVRNRLDVLEKRFAELIYSIQCTCQ